MKRHLPLAVWLALSVLPVLHATEPNGNGRDTSRGDAMLREYFRQETQKLADACLTDIETLEDWESRRGEYRRQLLEMLGLDPLPEKTPLDAVVTGTIDQEEFTVEKLHFQSRPGLYVTGNLYIPKEGEGPFPTVLYVCGHSRNVQDGVSYGNKVGYHHHGVWFARNGYVCLTIDTLQLGEIEGLHHGTYGRQIDGEWQQQWWWNSRGYTPAGVEAWNCVRAVDYLETRDEVDAERIGVTGRSGGGAYSWWIAAIDERIQCAVPVAGITDLENHVVSGMPGRLAEGCVEGHCDCMYIVNTYRWDYPLVAALVAPRPLLISNSDKDAIFPLDGVVRVHERVRDIYRLYEKEENLGLNITEGPHQDTQVLRIHAFHWFNRHLKGEEPLIEMAAQKVFQPEDLKVFPADELPADEINTIVQETFVPLAEPKVPESQSDWEQMREQWLTALEEKVFRGWPQERESLDVKQVFSATHAGVELSAYDFTSQGPWRLRLYLARGAEAARPQRVVLNVMNEEECAVLQQVYRAPVSEERQHDGDAPAHRGLHERLQGLVDPEDAQVICCVAPRGLGLTAWSGDERKQTHIRRRFMLLGQTLDGMRTWDVIRAAEAIREIDLTKDLPLHISAGSETSGLGLYASLFIPGVEGMKLISLPESHRMGPNLLNVQRYLDVPQALALAAERTHVIAEPAKESRDYLRQVTDALGWDKDRLKVEP